MKYLATLLLVLAVFCASYAQADEPEVDMSLISKPIAIKDDKAPLMTVIYNHKSHRKVGNNIPCQQCHHKSSNDTPYSSCTSAECHALSGAREREVLSIFMAFHSRDSEHSCYGCHSSLAERDPEKYAQFQNCRPCHISPEARKELERFAAQ